MGALQTSLSTVRPSILAMKFQPNVWPEKEVRVNSCTSHLTNSDKAIAPRSLQESILIQQAIAGDLESQDMLFAAHRTRLYRSAFKVLRNREDAEDAVQDGLLRAYAKLGSFQGRASFSTWMTRIVINSALMIRRKMHAHLEASLDEMLEDRDGRVALQTADQRPGPEQMCRVNEFSGLIEMEVRKLPYSARRAYQLLEMEGLSVSETIQTLGICKNSFKSRIRRARRKLVETLRRSLQSPVKRAVKVRAMNSRRRRLRHPNFDPRVPRTSMVGLAWPAQS
jgi:RNA polymerase sigma-70 factor (ECF subfamily)